MVQTQLGSEEAVYQMSIPRQVDKQPRGQVKLWVKPSWRDSQLKGEKLFVGDATKPGFMKEWWGGTYCWKKKPFGEKKFYSSVTKI